MAPRPALAPTAPSGQQHTPLMWMLVLVGASVPAHAADGTAAAASASAPAPLAPAPALAPAAVADVDSSLPLPKQRALEPVPKAPMAPEPPIDMLSKVDTQLPTVPPPPALPIAFQAASPAPASPAPPGLPGAPEAGVSTESASSVYQLVGHTKCLDAQGQEYEQWFLPIAASKSLEIPDDDVTRCHCPECHKACDDVDTCVGFQYKCCKEGDKTCNDGGASVLFGKGLRPDATPPERFTLQGPPQGTSSTSGEGFEGVGPIADVTNETSGDEHTFCYRKVNAMLDVPQGNVVVGSYYVPHTMNGTAKTTEATWRACQDRCFSTDGCMDWGFWPDNGCHLQDAEARLVKAKCPPESPYCDTLGVISGSRHTIFSRAAATISSSPLENQGLRVLAVLILLLVVAALVLYIFAQADWSKHRKKKRLMKNAAKRKEEAMLSDSGSDDDNGSEEENTPLSGAKAS